MVRNIHFVFSPIFVLTEGLDICDAAQACLPLFALSREVAATLMPKNQYDAKIYKSD